jgi:urease accessory protein
MRQLSVIAKATCSAGLVMLTPALAMAHPGHVESASMGSIWAGFLHPLTGLDHLLAMVAVGIWAAQLGGRALWVVPSAFLTMMVAGAALGLADVAFPLVESGITASVFALGLAILCAWKAPRWAAAALVGVFALFHGHAHGAELASGSSVSAFIAGFVIATALLHASGAALGLSAGRLFSGNAVRWAGGAVTAGGVALLAGL